MVDLRLRIYQVVDKTRMKRMFGAKTIRKLKGMTRKKFLVFLCLNIWFKNKCNVHLFHNKDISNKMKHTRFIHKSKRLRWDRNFTTYFKKVSLLTCYLLANAAKIQPKNSRCDAPGYEGRISGIPYC